MLPTSYPICHDTLRQVWQTFVTTGQVSSVDGYTPDPGVVRSWQRCVLRYDSFTAPRPTISDDHSFASLVKAQTLLLTNALPHMEDIHQYMEGSDCAIVLADGSGCLLRVIGDRRAVEMVHELRLGPGAYWSETYLGTNAVGMTLVDASPVQVVGAEHFFQDHHRFTSTAAPIHHVSGRIIGVIGIVGPAETSTSHTLSLVMAVARTIGSQLQTNHYLAEASYRLAEIKTILEAISTGVVSWDSENRVINVNARAAELLGINPSAVEGNLVLEALALPPVLRDAILDRTEFVDREMTFENGGVPTRSLVSLLPIATGEHGSSGCVMMINPIEQVHQLVRRVVGVQAALTLENMTAESSVMRSVLRQARIAGRGMAPVLLIGEGGVGKNPLARAIHNDSDRANRPFFAFNCRAIPHELMLNEFLGSDRNAQEMRPSKFELANGGTLVFDQIENLSLAMQEALLHVIETRHVMRLDGLQSIPVDVRIVATTSTNLEELVASGSFVPDLYYCFGVFNIEIPPLRERKDDIPFLVRRFLDRIARRDRTVGYIEVAEGAMEVLCNYPWPGNVRELESVLEQAYYLAEGPLIRAADLPKSIRWGRVLTASSPRALPVLTAAAAEREAIIRAGIACDGRVTEMARQLGIGRTTLWRKMKALNLTTADFKR
ncbi:MAG: PTS-dependent dihydroxyacetone kinase operon transcriptional regulator DhaR [Anaerolineae bacterium]|nr:PTS-dependent dihydroxyacetone kinase operon transcriptional regulator DhaR [Anaerolineae bacterium]